MLHCVKERQGDEVGEDDTQRRRTSIPPSTILISSAKHTTSSRLSARCSPTPAIIPTTPYRCGADMSNKDRAAVYQGDETAATRQSGRQNGKKKGQPTHEG